MLVNFRHWHPAATNIQPGRLGVIFELTYSQFAYKNAGIDNITITPGLCTSVGKYYRNSNMQKNVLIHRKTYLHKGKHPSIQKKHLLANIKTCIGKRHKDKPNSGKHQKDIKNV